VDDGLLGREAELVAVDDLLDRAGSGFAALVLEGEPGIGKTTVWGEGVRRAEALGFTVLACRPAEAEAKLSFSALTDLLERVPSDALGELPEPQRRALAVALLRSPAGDEDVEPRAVASAVRRVVAEWAVMNPVLVAVDDTQWLDAASARALEFALRRLADARVGLLAAQRSRSTRRRDRLELVGMEKRELGPLSLAAVHELLKRRLGRSLPRPVLVRVHEASRGNPFYALEIARELLSAEVNPGDPLPVPHDLRLVVRKRLGRMSAVTREVLMIAAATAERTAELLARGLGGDPWSALEEARRGEIVELLGDRVQFAHPLYAAAIYDAAASPRRKRLHQRLAELVEDVEERARHLALAADAPNAPVSAAVAEAAHAARARGAPEAAAELLEHSVRLTPAELEDDRHIRLLDLGEYLFEAGDFSGARRVFEELVEEVEDGPHRSLALLGLAAAHNWGESTVGTIEYCEQALVAARGDAAVEARCHAELAIYLADDVAGADGHAQAAIRLCEELGDDADPRTYSTALAAAARVSFFSGRGLPVRLLEKAIEVESRGPPPSYVLSRASTMFGQWCKHTDDFGRARSLLEESRQAALDEGDESSLPNCLMHLALCELWAGNWNLASDYAEESVEAADRIGQSPTWVVAVRALVDAHLGRVERVRVPIVELLESGESDALTVCLYLRVLGFLELSLGRPEQAEPYLSRAVVLATEAGILEPSYLRVHADAVEALLALGQLEQAEAVLQPWIEQARRSRLAWSLATSARCRALLEGARGSLDAALTILEDALAEYDGLPVPFELARTLLVKGEIERRARRKAAARRSLERALAVFDQLGAALWVERARAELQRTGLRRATGDELTETEQRVAELAASGLTNREVAARLFMSSKTVEANLARIYRKLGIRSRAELGARLGPLERRETPDSSSAATA
jgi:DNA-binding CsgD family transcriptional regulator